MNITTNCQAGQACGMEVLLWVIAVVTAAVVIVGLLLTIKTETSQ